MLTVVGIGICVSTTYADDYPMPNETGDVLACYLDSQVEVL